MGSRNAIICDGRKKYLFAYRVVLLKSCLRSSLFTKLSTQDVLLDIIQV